MKFPFFNFDKENAAHRKANMGIGVSLGGCIIGITILFVLIRGCNKSEPRIETDAETAQELRNLNNKVIVAKEDLLKEAQKTADEVRKQNDEQNAELVSIHTDIKSYKTQSDAKANRIAKYNDNDIISEFAKLERDFKRDFKRNDNITSKSVKDSTTDY